MTQLHRVLYCSRNCLSGDAETIAEEIRRILAKSRENNARDGITGGLLFSEGCFAQVLEGPTEAVHAAFERIQCDERHEDVTILDVGSIEVRDFPSWSMAFSGADSASNPLAASALADAFMGRSAGGEAVLQTLRSVIVSEDDWLISSAA